MPFFICPNCKQRSVDLDGREGLSQQAVACRSCGFGFLFELMEDYYPAPNTGFVVTDKTRRVIAVGRGVFELTGFREPDVLGRDLVEALGLEGWEEQRNPADLALEWGVRRLGERLVLRTRGGQGKHVVADFFPAYDADGGLLVALSPRR
jgi:PAS domain-containing protein